MIKQERESGGCQPYFLSGTWRRGNIWERRRGNRKEPAKMSKLQMGSSPLQFCILTTALVMSFYLNFGAQAVFEFPVIMTL